MSLSFYFNEKNSLINQFSPIQQCMNYFLFHMFVLLVVIIIIMTRRTCSNQICYKVEMND